MWCIYMGIIYKKTCIINCILLCQVDASHSALPWHREDKSMSSQSSEGNARCRDIYIHIWIFIAVNMEVQWLFFYLFWMGKQLLFWQRQCMNFKPVRGHMNTDITGLDASDHTATIRQKCGPQDRQPYLFTSFRPMSCSIRPIYISPIHRWATSAASHVAILLVVLPITAGPVAPKPAIIRLKEASGQKQSDAATSSTKAASGWTGDRWISSSRPELLYFTFP